ncbi:Hypothetical predicted protein [Podarcis lilfordi]|uniref:Uncharacterized protein n=1 Tax=Podarcis lilfordi TaxID=74358 RepID=A0AA35PP96_9SAUR|nr:Hypothetical predicted protein [Podarcis lilfordi]
MLVGKESALQYLAFPSSDQNAIDQPSRFACGDARGRAPRSSPHGSRVRRQDGGGEGGGAEGLERRAPPPRRQGARLLARPRLEERGANHVVRRPAFLLRAAPPLPSPLPRAAATALQLEADGGGGGGGEAAVNVVAVAAATAFCAGKPRARYRQPPAFCGGEGSGAAVSRGRRCRRAQPARVLNTLSEYKLEEANIS